MRATPVLYTCLAVALAALVAGGACKRERDEQPAGAPAVAAAPAEPVPPKEPPLAPSVTVPDGPAVAAPLLRERPSEAECAAACERILAAESAPWLEGTADDAKEDVGRVLAGLSARERPRCVRRCTAEFSRAVTECVRLTKDVAAAVDCVTKSGLVGPAD